MQWETQNTQSSRENPSDESDSEFHCNVLTLLSSIDWWCQMWDGLTVCKNFKIAQLIICLLIKVLTQVRADGQSCTIKPLFFFPSQKDVYFIGWILID